MNAHAAGVQDSPQFRNFGVFGAAHRSGPGPSRARLAGPGRAYDGLRSDGVGGVGGVARERAHWAGRREAAGFLLTVRFEYRARLAYGRCAGARKRRHIRESNGGTMGNDGGGMSGGDIGFIDTARAAAWLGLSRRTLDGYRVSGGGPAFHRFGNRVRYRRADLDAWAAERRATTTAEADRLKAR